MWSGLASVGYDRRPNSPVASAGSRTLSPTLQCPRIYHTSLSWAGPVQWSRLGRPSVAGRLLSHCRTPSCARANMCWRFGSLDDRDAAAKFRSARFLAFCCSEWPDPRPSSQVLVSYCLIQRPAGGPIGRKQVFWRILAQIQ